MLATEFFAKNPTLLMWLASYIFASKPNSTCIDSNRGLLKLKSLATATAPNKVIEDMSKTRTVWLSFATTTVPESQRTVGSWLHLFQPLLPGALGEFSKCDGCFFFWWNIYFLIKKGLRNNSSKLFWVDRHTISILDGLEKPNHERHPFEGKSPWLYDLVLEDNVVFL